MLKMDNSSYYFFAGKVDGFSSIYVYNIDENMCTVYLSNGENYSVSELINLSFKILLCQSPIAFPKIEEVFVSDLNVYKGNYVSDFPQHIEIKIEDNRLVGIINCKSKFYLKCVDKNDFIVIGKEYKHFIFDIDKNKLLADGVVFLKKN